MNPWDEREVKVTIWKKLNPFWWFLDSDLPCGRRWWFEKHCKKCNLICKLKFAFRNPFHDFTHYVIGVQHKIKDGSCNPYCDYKRICTKNWIITIDKIECKFINLYWIDFKHKSGKYEFYIGWRCGGGFGIANRFYFKNPRKWEC